MRKFLMVLGLVIALAIPAVALAADLAPGRFGDLIYEGNKCEDGAYYHFVNNQTALFEKAPGGGTLTATFAGVTQTAGPTAILRYVQHFIVFSEDELQSASTNLQGNLVLSGIECK